jgi:hypothetical protein
MNNKSIISITNEFHTPDGGILPVGIDIISGFMDVKCNLFAVGVDLNLVNSFISLQF